jgi:hypothetical protein
VAAGDSPYATRLFTPKEANAFIPHLTGIFASTREELERARALAREMSELGFPITDLESGELNPTAPAAVQAKHREIGEVVERLRARLREVGEMGVEVKAADGLVDFRSRYRGNVVYLCWRYGEPTVAFWHDLEAGVAGRTPLIDPDAFEGDYLQ